VPFHETQYLHYCGTIIHAESHMAGGIMDSGPVPVQPPPRWTFKIGDDQYAGPAWDYRDTVPAITAALIA
jgi:hypothetical protein